MAKNLPKGVMLNAYPDSIGGKLADIVEMLKRPEFENVFSLFYILPTFFDSDLDRGFSVIDYDINQELVTESDVQALDKLGIRFKFDFVLNHLSVASPQFQDMLEHGDVSQYKDFFINWNEFWSSTGRMGPDGIVIPNEECMQKLFMRKPGLPILKVLFPDGSERPYWNTFYQEVNYQELNPDDLSEIEGLSRAQVEEVLPVVNATIHARADFGAINLGRFSDFRDAIVAVIEQKRQYKGQMDLNAQSEMVWEFYDETLRKLRGYGARLVRLDAFAYLHKQPGMSNFFNRPGTWEYLERLKQLAAKYDLLLLPEIHSEYGTGIHKEMTGEGYVIYDFFFPGLVVDAIERGANDALLRWINELLSTKMTTVNMLGCHDGIPVLDLVGKDVDGVFHPGLLEDEHINEVMQKIVDRGGRVKNLYGPDGKKISYYQVNATFFSALGEDEQRLRLARAIQLFMPGIPQIWYLDLFAGKNDYVAADRGGTGGHKEINRTNLSVADVELGLQQSIVRDQLNMIRLRNTSPAFDGELEVGETEPHLLQLSWTNGDSRAVLNANLKDHNFVINYTDESGQEKSMTFGYL